MKRAPGPAPVADTPGRAKLRALGVDLPIYPSTTGGGLPKPPALADAQARAARGEFPREKLESMEKRATEFWVRLQDKLGLDVLSGGGMPRIHPVSYFTDRLPGFYPGGWVRVYGNRYFRKPVIVGDVRWPGPLTVAGWKFAQGLTARPVKAVLTGPYTLAARSFNEHYPSRAEACLALAGALRAEAEALAAAGVKVLQIDEPALGARPGDLPVARQALELVTAKLPFYVILHACRGPLHTALRELARWPVDNLDLECGVEPGETTVVRGEGADKDVSITGVDARSADVETAADVAERLSAAGRLLGEARAWAGVDCELRHLSVEQARAKLARLAEACAGLRSAPGGNGPARVRRLQGRR